MKIDLKHNELATIPHSLLELPSLEELNLSYNQLTEIPNVPEWSPCLSKLNLSHNQLSSLTDKVVARTIHTLNLSHNKFKAVPPCICSFVTLYSLNLSDNPDILTLPAEMGRLKLLTCLYLNNLKDLIDPPRNIHQNAGDCIRYLKSKLRSAKGFFRMKLMLVGQANRGKTTLVKRLQGKDCGNRATDGVEISEWSFNPSFRRKPYHFSIWDFGGQEEYYVTHQCFLSQRSLYLMLFNLTDGEAGVQELKPWLNNIALRAPWSCVIIVGTHLDEVPVEKRDGIDALLHRVGGFAVEYSDKLQIVEVMAVALKNRIENIGLLKEAIYNHATNYKTRAGHVIMGQEIPASYHALDKQLEVVQQEVRRQMREPVMHSEEFSTMVQQMNLADIQDEDELKTATLFLTDVGSLLHYDDRSHNLHELYFVDPRWLCDMMSKVVTIKERNPFVKKGILYSKDIPLLFKDEVFPWKYFEQYLTLLDRFEIALPLDNKRILIPSMLPDERPKRFAFEDAPVYSRYILFNSAVTPPGFWSRLLSRIMHSITQVCFALDKTTPSTLAIESPSQWQEEEELDLSMTMNPVPCPNSLHLDPSVTVSEDIATDSLEASSLPSPTPKISRPITVEQDEHQLILPNFPSPPPIRIGESYNIKDIQLEYWHSGLYYKDPGIMFRIESLIKSPQARQKKDGVLIVTSPNNEGKKIIGQLVDLVVALINEWYPGLAENQHGATNLEQRIPCFECVKMKRPKPFEFRQEQCLQMIVKNQTTIECRYDRDDPAKNHTVSLADVVPDLLLQDIDPEFLLNPVDITYQDNKASLLGEGGYGKVYKGTYKNKFVAIKRYHKCREEALAELRSEAKLLQQSHHPCLVCLVGVCVHPMMALILEEAPLKSLDYPLLKKKLPVHRLTIFRIVAEVAAALRFLHSQGIIFRDLTAANILLWTLDPASLCHCKVTDFGIATHMAPLGARGLRGTKGFIAPEVLHIGKRKQRSVYDHKADIFSLGMFLYQMIARRRPYHEMSSHRIDVAVEMGMKPTLQNVDIATTGFHYLTLLMKKCWLDNPKIRPNTDEIIKKVCLASMQSVMHVSPVKSSHSLRKAIALTPTNFATKQTWSNELWTFCDSTDGVQLNICNPHSMVKATQKCILKDHQVKCIALCNDHIWVGSRPGIGDGVISIFNIDSRELVCTIESLKQNSASCLTLARDRVLVGTFEGFCFNFSSNVTELQQDAKPQYRYVSEHAVDGIVCTNDFIWVSHTRYIYFLNPDNLALEGSVSCRNNIGQLSTSPSKDIIWSAHINGAILTAWDAHNQTHSFDINTGEKLQEIAADINEHDAVITAMLPALNTVWVGMATGHIMVFHDQELLAWYQPYKEYVRFLTLIPGSGPCKMEKCMVVSGGKKFISLVKDMGPDYEKEDEKGQPLDRAGVLVIWEAYEAKTMRQIKLVEENAPGFFDTHDSIRRMIHNGNFRDGTHISRVAHTPSQDTVPYSPDLEAQPNLNYFSTSSPDPNTQRSWTMGGFPPHSTNSHPRTRSQTFFDSPVHHSVSERDEEQLTIGHRHSSQTPTVTGITPVTHSKEIFEITLLKSSQVVCILCSKPPALKDLLSELQVNASLSEAECCLEYTKSPGEVVKIQSQKHLNTYMALSTKPKLCCQGK